MPQSASQPHRQSDSYKNYYNYPESGVGSGADYTAASGTVTGYVEEATYQASHKYVQQSKASTNVPEPVDTLPITQSIQTNVANCNSRASSYVVSILAFGIIQFSSIDISYSYSKVPINIRTPTCRYIPKNASQSFISLYSSVHEPFKTGYANVYLKICVV